MPRPRGLTKTGGRKAGTPNKATAEIKIAARELSPAATKRLKKLLESENESVALGAIREVYDRAFGKATQPIAGDDDMPAIKAALKVAFVGSSDSRS